MHWITGYRWRMFTAKKSRKESAILNNKTFRQYYNRLAELAISVYEWKNLPETVDERFLELTLFTDGAIVFFLDDVIGHLCLSVALGGDLNVYNVPGTRRAHATNGYYKELTAKDSVIIYNNYLRTNSVLDIELYAMRLYEIERTIDVNVRAQKTPLIIRCDENQRLTLKNLYMQYSGNEPLIYGDKELDIDNIKAIPTNAPYVANELNILKRQIWGEALTYLGIENSNTEKRERLITDEVITNLGGVSAQRFTKLNARKKAAEEINKMFGLDVEVDFREKISGVTDDMCTEGWEDE